MAVGVLQGAVEAWRGYGVQQAVLGAAGVLRALVGCPGGYGVLQRCCRTASNPTSPVQPPGGPQPRARRLAALLNRSLRVRMSDGRTLVGAFLCTDRDANIILGSAQEFLKAAGTGPRREMGPQGQ